jgi:BRCA1-associated protein
LIFDVFHKHSVAHFQETNHPYSLELATLRIWDYVHGEYGGYAHRADLLECPSSPPLSHPWIARLRSSSLVSVSKQQQPSYPLVPYAATTAYASGVDAKKSPKKATMIGEEYEALLQSALEDQAQHYEGEITRLRAKLRAAMVDQSSMTPEEQRVVEHVRGTIDRLRHDIDHVSRDLLLDVQAQEAGHRATSQRLLSEQQEANELLKEIEEEAQKTNEENAKSKIWSYKCKI